MRPPRLSIRRVALALRSHAAVSGLVAVMVAFAAVACTSSSATMDVAESPRIPLRVSIDELMIQWINPASFAVWDAAREQDQPRTEADWRRLEDQALQLVAAGTVTALPGTGPRDAEWVAEESWIEFTRQMTDAAEQALEAARARDLDAFLDAGNALVEPCEACHAAYRPMPGS